MNRKRIAVDLAKSVFKIAESDGNGKVMMTSSSSCKTRESIDYSL